ncbi:helix-turn-helix domain-containing protein [Streptomyces sp. NPDC001743]|uniref:TetR/AcrR family transcriptional regulator n=1 Tax=Streptomyces sp. NPDC001743 TaxID=3154397 RepID=UPI0033348199
MIPASTFPQHRRDHGRGPRAAAAADHRGRRRAAGTRGRDAVTTRAVAVAAGLQPPAVYRLFGDKDGLPEAVAEHGFAEFLAAKRGGPVPHDPLADLRAGWDLAVEFGLAHPALYTLMYSEPDRTASRS